MGEVANKNKFNFRIELSRRSDLCDENFTRVYRTVAVDERCKPLKFLPVRSGVKRSALASFPGSGNSWTRHMIEQATGIYTGSAHQDRLSTTGILVNAWHAERN